LEKKKKKKEKTQASDWSQEISLNVGYTKREGKWDVIVPEARKNRRSLKGGIPCVLLKPSWGSATNLWCRVRGGAIAGQGYAHPMHGGQFLGAAGKGNPNPRRENWTRQDNKTVKIISVSTQRDHRSLTQESKKECGTKGAVHRNTLNLPKLKRVFSKWG